MKKLTKEEQQRLALNQKLDQILLDLGYQVEKCWECDDGGFYQPEWAEPGEHEAICHICKGSKIKLKLTGRGSSICNIERKQCDGNGW